MQQTEIDAKLLYQHMQMCLNQGLDVKTLYPTIVDMAFQIMNNLIDDILPMPDETI